MSLIEAVIGQPGKTPLGCTFTPNDLNKDERLLHGPSEPAPQSGGSRTERKILNNNIIELPEYIVDPKTKTTYLKGKFLGKGGFAKVHELTDLTTNKMYAGKIIPESRLTKPHQKEKILREIDLHRPLQHKNVVRFHHFFEDEENVYIILEYCPRKSLVHVLKNRRVLTEPEVRYYMRQLAEGVRYIHSQGVIHRDLKLGNMFLSEDMEMKIGDFGLATHIGGPDTTSKKFTVCGTPNYIAPEVLNMVGHGCPADVWAMGCIMYAMLVGQPPFETSTIGETYSRITSNKYTIPPNISDSARRLIAKMLRSKPVDRPSPSEILQHEFFFSGYMPQALSTACCTVVPKFPAVAVVSRVSSGDPLSVEVDKAANSVTALHLCPLAKSDQLKPKSESAGKKELQKKELGFHSTLKQKLSSVLCPDKSKKNKNNTAAAMYHAILTCLDAMPKDGPKNLSPLSSNPTVFITKWIDYSNKYGFGFQLSDRSVGVLFNDMSKMSLSSDRMHMEFHDGCGKLSIYSQSSVPSQLQERYTLLRYFAQYMDENLTEGGILQHDLVKRKVPIPCMKRWVRSSHAIIMQMTNGTLQINFFKDHTKIVISNEHHSEGLVMFIDEDRHSSTYSLEDLARHGCDSTLRNRLQYALTVLHEFAELEESI